MSHHSHEGSARGHNKSSDKSNSNNNSKSRLSTNKLYRTPPTHGPGELNKREKSFTLDCIAVSNISNDYSRANPKLGQVAPPYNAQRDHNCGSYFTFTGVDKTLKQTKQVCAGKYHWTAPTASCAANSRLQRFLACSHIYDKPYVMEIGHSTDQISNHGQFMRGVKPINGFNGNFGYRRNTPSLRQRPSEFGVATWTPIY